jgi:hypothetical protein
MISPINSQNKTGNIIYNISFPNTLERVRTHDFNPLSEDNSMIFDRSLNVPGNANLNNDDWRIRLLAVRDLVRAGNNSVKEIVTGLTDKSAHVRQVCAMALGILRSTDAIRSLEQLVRQDENTMVRSQAVIALGQIEAMSSLGLLRDKLTTDPSRDVRHQCELAIYQIEKKMGTTEGQLSAFLSLDETTFNSMHTGSIAPDFKLDDTDGKEWILSEFQNKK